MMRRSKLKIRPAIKKGPASGAVRNNATVKSTALPSSPKSVLPTEEISAVKKSSEAQQSVGSAVSEVSHSDEIENPVAAVCSVSPLETELNNLEVEQTTAKVEAGNALQAEKNEKLSDKTPTLKTRRRKLVACPQMAKKRLKIINSEQIQPKTVPVAEVSPSPSIDPRLDQDTATITINKILQSEEIAVEVPEPACDVTVAAGDTRGPDDGVACKDLITLTPVMTPDLAESCETHMEEKNEASQLRIPQSAVSKKSLAAVHRNTEKSVSEHALKHKTAEKLRAKSKSAIHRSNAMEKLRKLRQNQEGEENDWPEIDHNVVSMSDLIYLNPPMKFGKTLGMNLQKDGSNEIAISDNQTSSTGAISTEGENEDTVMPVPQIRIAEDGTVVVDEESIVMDTQKPVDPKISTVYEFGRDAKVNQCSFLRRPHARPSRWTQTETDKFYSCLCIVGAEFSLMGAMFRERSSDDLRRKYKRERKINPGRIDKALMQQHLSKWTDDMFEPKNTDPEKVDGEAIT